MRPGKDKEELIGEQGAEAILSGAGPDLNVPPMAPEHNEPREDKIIGDLEKAKTQSLDEISKKARKFGSSSMDPVLSSIAGFNFKGVAAT